MLTTENLVSWSFRCGTTSRKEARRLSKDTAKDAWRSPWRPTRTQTRDCSELPTQTHRTLTSVQLKRNQPDKERKPSGDCMDFPRGLSAISRGCRVSVDPRDIWEFLKFPQFKYNTHSDWLPFTNFVDTRALLGDNKDSEHFFCWRKPSKYLKLS